MKFATALLDTGVERALDSIRGKISAPIAIELWDGRTFALGPKTKIRLKVPRASSLKYLVKQTLGSLAEAYVEGEIEVEGSMRDVVEAADTLAASNESRAWDAVTFAAHRHTRKADREAIQHHYDVSNAFY